MTPATTASSLEIIVTVIFFFGSKALVISPLPISSDKNCNNCFLELNIVKNLEEKVEIWNYETLDETNRIAKEIKRKLS